MSKTERLLTIVAMGALTMAFVFPVWNIQIWAPQYPEGLSMSIGLDRVTGNLDQINILNHYIGMKHITPESIPELQIMPRIMQGAIALGLVLAVWGSRQALGAWLVGFVLSAFGGLYDFWRWGYDYGHNLSATAPLKVPGMNYQPPLIGHKQILNIDSYSYPDVGGWAVALAVALILAALCWPRLRGLVSVARVSKLSLAAALIAASLLSGCKVAPSPLQAGQDNCEACRMTITDNRFGGEVITDKGRVLKFDAVACLAGFSKTLKSEPQSLLVSDYLRPGTLVDARTAHFLKSARIDAPMGDGLVASADVEGLKALQARVTGEVLDWNAVLKSTVE